MRPALTSAIGRDSGRVDVTVRSIAPIVERTGRAVALGGAVLALSIFGAAKFTQGEIDELKPLIGGTPWLAWLPPAFGDAGTSYLLGVVELSTAALLIASPWSPRAGVAGGALGALTFAATTSLLVSAPEPIWEAEPGSAPLPSSLGSFVLKDVALLGIALTVLGESLARVAQERSRPE
ncbi:MAG: hypothetical protein AVDCRST_MAG90-3226 [uncultured Microvirga sp.]|uniref:Membrane protein ykgB n=1 Tax=uncultured Microvirga sp. TaxID=412392 RepID=A0A6J4MN76_9HYPH|nr:MAG: hypothetical protein AVDCRST_MAG90-3226 [uncultured Microvirga sp.]